jgi:hypothetical protein
VPQQLLLLLLYAYKHTTLQHMLPVQQQARGWAWKVGAAAHRPRLQVMVAWLERGSNWCLIRRALLLAPFQRVSAQQSKVGHCLVDWVDVVRSQLRTCAANACWMYTARSQARLFSH